MLRYQLRCAGKLSRLFGEPGPYEETLFFRAGVGWMGSLVPEPLPVRYLRQVVDLAFRLKLSRGVSAYPAM